MEAPLRVATAASYHWERTPRPALSHWQECPGRGPLVRHASRDEVLRSRDPPLWFCENSGFDLLYATDGVGCVALELGCAPAKDSLLKDALLEAHSAAWALIADAINALAPSSVERPIHEERLRLDALASQAAQRHVSQLVDFFSGRNLRDDEDPSSKRDRGKAQDRAFFDVIEAVSSELDGDERAVKAAAARAVEALGREAMAQAASNNARSDRRRTDELRVLQSRCGTLQVPHGSSSFSRGETRVDSTVTLAAPPSRRVPSLDADPNASFREHGVAKDGPPRCREEAAARVQPRPGHIFVIEKYRSALHAALRLPLVRHGRHEGHSEGEPTRGRPRRAGRSGPYHPSSPLALDSPTLPL